MDKPDMFDLMMRRVVVRKSHQGLTSRRLIAALKYTHKPSSDQILGLPVLQNSPQPPTAAVAKPDLTDAERLRREVLERAHSELNTAVLQNYPPPPTASVAKPDLTDAEWLQREVLRRVDGEVNTTASLRTSLRRPMEQLGIDKPRKALQEEVEELTKAGVVDSWPQLESSGVKRKGGWPVRVLCKKPWRKVASHVTARAAVARLQLSACHFPEADC